MPATIPTGPARAAAALAALTVLSAAASAHYTVQPGDTLSGIAARHATTVAELARANDLADPDHVRAGQRLAVPGEAHAAGAPRAASRAEVEVLLERTAREHGWSSAFVKALAWQESGWNNTVVSSAGAVGVMQVLPSTGEFVSRNLAGRTLDLGEPADNVLAGVLFLDYLYDLTGGDAELTLAGYYQGLRSVRQHGAFADTERYVANVLALRDRFR